MLLSKLKVASRPVGQGGSRVFLKDPNFGSENRALIQGQRNPVIALKRSCSTSCAPLAIIYVKLQRYGNAVLLVVCKLRYNHEQSRRKHD
ncbi:MAG: hypothetical protein ACI9LY_002985 [Arenicella sp.]|jgi:hypothetical protein